MIHSELLQGHRLHLHGATDIPPACQQLQQPYYSADAAAGSDIISPPTSTSSRSSFSSYSSYSARRGDHVFSPLQPHSHPQQQAEEQQHRLEGSWNHSDVSGPDAVGLLPSAGSSSRTDLRSGSSSTDPSRPCPAHYSPNTPADQHLYQSQLGRCSVPDDPAQSKSTISGAKRHPAGYAYTETAQQTAHYRHPMATSPIPPMQPGYMSQLATYMAEMVVYLWFSPPKQRRAPAFAKPSSSFRRFCQDLLMTTQVSQSVVVLALLFVWKLQGKHAIEPKSGSEYKLTVTALMLANKILDDHTYTNKTWSDVSGLPLTALNEGEMEFLQGLDFSLYVSQTTFSAWVELLERPQRARTMSISRKRARVSAYASEYATAPSAPTSPIHHQHPTALPPQAGPNPGLGLEELGSCLPHRGADFALSSSSQNELPHSDIAIGSYAVSQGSLSAVPPSHPSFQAASYPTHYSAYPYPQDGALPSTRKRKISQSSVEERRPTSSYEISYNAAYPSPSSFGTSEQQRFAAGPALQVPGSNGLAYTPVSLSTSSSSSSSYPSYFGFDPTPYPSSSSSVSSAVFGSQAPAAEGQPEFSTLTSSFTPPAAGSVARNPPQNLAYYALAAGQQRGGYLAYELPVQYQAVQQPAYYSATAPAPATEVAPASSLLPPPVGGFLRPAPQQQYAQPERQYANLPRYSLRSSSRGQAPPATSVQSQPEQRTPTQNGFAAGSGTARTSLSLSPTDVLAGPNSRPAFVSTRPSRPYFHSPEVPAPPPSAPPAPLSAAGPPPSSLSTRSAAIRPSQPGAAEVLSSLPLPALPMAPTQSDGTYRPGYASSYSTGALPGQSMLPVHNGNVAPVSQMQCQTQQPAQAFYSSFSNNGFPGVMYWPGVVAFAGAGSSQPYALPLPHVQSWMHRFA